MLVRSNVKLNRSTDHPNATSTSASQDSVPTRERAERRIHDVNSERDFFFRLSAVALVVVVVVVAVRFSFSASCGTREAASTHRSTFVTRSIHVCRWSSETFDSALLRPARVRSSSERTLEFLNVVERSPTYVSNVPCRRIDRGSCAGWRAPERP